ncbi:MAG: sodium:solute symporter family protein [Acidaminococcaceae bacterium]|nr:sodium:solute symporter family protein [Acidaminococcaceae bacterium]
MQLDISFLHMIIMLLTIAVVIFGGIYAAGAVKSAEGYSLGGRSAGFHLVAGSIAGTVIGGGATVGTAQMASTVGLSAWWFTLASGITFIVMGFLYARPLRKTGLETISQYLVLNYGKTTGSIASWVTTIGIFFSVVSSCLPGIGIICAVFGVSMWTAALILILLVACYVFFGGMKSAGVGGILKMIILFASLFLAGGSAFWAIHTDPAIGAALPDFPWFSLVGNGTGNAASNLLSVFVGIICTQTYIQALFSAKDPQTAAYGAFAAALVAIPVGLPCAMIGMYMHVAEPDVLPLLVLPTYLLHHQPALIGGMAMGGIIISLIRSIGGQSLGMGTIISKDILAPLLEIKKDSTLLKLNRFTVVLIMVIGCVFSIIYKDTQILFWNYLSMGLRGGGIFLPLTLAVFRPKCARGKWVILSMAASTLVAIAATILQTPVKPMFLAVAVSFLLLLPGMLGRKE